MSSDADRVWWRGMGLTPARCPIVIAVCSHPKREHLYTRQVVKKSPTIYVDGDGISYHPQRAQIPYSWRWLTRDEYRSRGIGWWRRLWHRLDFLVTEGRL